MPCCLAVLRSFNCAVSTVEAWNTAVIVNISNETVCMNGA